MKKLAFTLATTAGALFCSSFLASTTGAASLTNQPGSGLTPQASAFRWSEIGAKAGAYFHGGGLSLTSPGTGAGLSCAFQRLEGEATTEGLWLVSTVTNATQEGFRVVATAVGRAPVFASSGETPSELAHDKNACATKLPPTGKVEVAAKLARLLRPGLIEEYSVNVDGVRQDFVVMERPEGTGDLQVHLAVSGAGVESARSGAVLVLNNSRRRIAYSRLRASDATGRELPARMEASKSAECGMQNVEFDFTLVVDDSEAVYPVRIDPTFSDANWVSMGGLPGANGNVYAAVLDGSGNFYIGGNFTIVGDVFATNIAKWDGSSWSALGSGMNGGVVALTVSGSYLYAGGGFTMAGGVAATNIAKWDGSTWTNLGSGMNGDVWALAVSGIDLYAGGAFTTAGGSAANYIAKWNGSSWSALGPGMFDAESGNTYVFALAVSGSDLYAGGHFTTAGGVAATNIAKWGGSTWSALGSGMGGADYPSVNALAVSGSDLYAGGYFTNAGGVSANCIAKWNGNSWSALGSGMDNTVHALTVSGSDLYAGGDFWTAGGVLANYIAKWNGSSWSALGPGVFNAGSGNTYVSALAVSGSDLYAGGRFTTAGGSGVNSIAKWNGSGWSALGSGMAGGDGFNPPTVDALAVSGSDIYAGGNFTTAGGVSANYIAKWNGSSWSALGSEMNNPVYALAVSSSGLYAGGAFTNAGGSAANYIAKWNGSTWTNLGLGMNDWVRALAVSGSGL